MYWINRSTAMKNDYYNHFYATPFKILTSKNQHV